MAFPENLKRKRMERGISAEQLAEKFGIRRQRIYEFENGVKVPNVVLAVGIASFLGTTCEELVGGESK